jgi:C2H2-type zinc finger
MATQAKAKGSSTASGQFTCPECGRTFTRAQALGAHRRQAHGVVGTSKTATRRKATLAPASRSRRAGSTSVAAATANGRRSKGRTTAGVQRRQTPRGSTSSRRVVNRDALLAAIFPAGVPPRQDVISAANTWLDEAERLARLR